jgi:3-methyladenine DNA glycosylase/8-oxoguanine DNA glycosylase
VGAAEIRLQLPFRIDLAPTVASHGWVHLAPWRWDPRAVVLARPERVADARGTVAVAQPDPGTLVVRAEGFPREAEDQIIRRVRRWLSADWDPADAIAILGEEAELIRLGGGRMLRGSTFYEDFIKTVLTINTAWSSTCRMAAALVDEPGGGRFPWPGEILEYGEARLRDRAKLGFRAATVIAATSRMLGEQVIDHQGEGEPPHDYLIGLRGVGPYAAAHCRLLLHDFSRLPVDSAVTAYLRARYASDPASFAASRSGWGAYLALGYRLQRLREKLGAAPG